MSAALRRAGSKAGVDYPTSLGQFDDWFQSDADCARYLEKLRWPNGFLCPKCEQPARVWITKRYLYVCSECAKQTSLIAGTIFEGTRLPLLSWLRAAWLVSSKDGVSATELQRELGIGYHASWLLLQKLRLAMHPSGDDQDKLSGDIEIDRTFLGRAEPNGKGARTEGKVFIAIAVERASGRARIKVVPDEKAKRLLDFVQDTCEQGSTIHTSGWALHERLSSRGFEHTWDADPKNGDSARAALQDVRRVEAEVKRWLRETHHGGIGAQHADAYLDEFLFRFNRLSSNPRGLLFYRLLQNAVVRKKLDYETIVWSRRGEVRNVRGPKRDPAAVRRGGRSDVEAAGPLTAPTRASGRRRPGATGRGS